MHPHQSWGGWDSHTSSWGHDLHSTAGRREAGPLGVKTPRSQTGTELGRLAFYKYYM